MGELITGLKIEDIISTYEQRKVDLPVELEEVVKAQEELKNNTSIMGAFGGTPFKNMISMYDKDSMLRALKKSAWRYVYEQLNIEHIAPKTHLKEFERLLEQPPEFEWDNIRDVFKEYVQDPRGKALQAFAEVFSNLDPFYKSHDNFGVGKKGLPKRVIIGWCGQYGYESGWEKVADIVNALMRYRGRLDLLVKGRNIKDIVFSGESYQGLSFKHFQNENCHVIFDKQAMTDINLCLHEYYGEVLPDVYEHTDKKAESKEVSKDLQFYRTPQKAVDFVMRDIYIQDHDEVLEPSCGDGALISGILKENKTAIVTGVEYDAGRALECRSKFSWAGVSVHTGNFLEWKPVGTQHFDKVVMNPPFYGKHYAKHIKHAMKFLKDGGMLYAILPATARYEHKELEEFKNKCWKDLPMGSFKESGTNVNTVLLTIRNW